jgi:cyclophilin family peptidyl-prolyl cis-trans isomerase
MSFHALFGRKTVKVLFPFLLFATTALMVSCSGDAEPLPTPPDITTVVVQKASPRSFVLSWQTSVATSGTVLWGTNADSLPNELPVRAMTTYHRVSVDSLEPGETYFFQVTALTYAGGRAISPTDSVNTPLKSDEPKVKPSPEKKVIPGFDVAVVSTDYGEFAIRFAEETCPIHVANFKRLVNGGFYNGTTFHRVVPQFVIQGGDPLSKDDDRKNDGMGGPGYTLPAEIKHPHKRGSVAAARTGGRGNPEKRSSGSQFYVCLKDLKELDGEYTVFGHVISGMNVVSTIAGVERDKKGIIGTPDNPFMPVRMTIHMEKKTFDEPVKKK